MKKIKISLAACVLICSLSSFIFLKVVGSNYGFDAKTLLPNEQLENVVKTNTVPSVLPDISIVQRILLAVSDIIKAI